MLRYFGYAKCGTCRKAKAYLDKKKLSYTEIDITEQPPAKSVLKAALQSGDYTLRDLFNKSGVQYREYNMKEKLKTLTEAQALDLLSTNGRLIKRPVITDGKKITIGFDEAKFKQVWK